LKVLDFQRIQASTGPHLTSSGAPDRPAGTPHPNWGITMSNVEKLVRTSLFNTIRVETTPSNDAHWMYMHADTPWGVRPCFRTALMEDMWAYLTSITLRESQRKPGELRHVVIASDAEAFNLGGDLNLFAQLIRENNRHKLLEYARRCIDGVYHIHTGLGGDVRTIALLQGDALGGGLELALACHTIVAEEGVGMGLPEVLFGLFPGMGAYSFLCKRVSPQLAEKIILEGKIYSSEEMHALGIVDVLVPKGEGEAAVEEVIRKQQRTPHAHLALNAVRNIAQPIGYDELMGITEVWVDTALALGDKSLRTMERIVKAQERIARHAAA
jgi:DSF synthase